MNIKRDHLNENRYIIAVIDKNDLHQSEIDHLAACSACRAEKKRFEQELENLGRLAKDIAPISRQKPALILNKKSELRPFRPVFVTGFALTLLTAVILWSTTNVFTPTNITSPNLTETEADRHLISEIEGLETLALSVSYWEIPSEVDGYMNDDFINFIAPFENGTAINLDDRAKSREFNNRWLSKKGHIQNVVFFQERGHTYRMPSV
ncbi:MAG: hypothetical protein H8E17_19430 [Deltaproteobacteria bacterium]|nr:hypothetical protein [Deltaproteobacteria bacterium]